METVSCVFLLMNVSVCSVLIQAHRMLRCVFVRDRAK